MFYILVVRFMLKTFILNSPVEIAQMKPLGEVLQRAGLLSTQQIERALQAQAQSRHLKIGKILAAQGSLKLSTANFFADQLPKLLKKSQKQVLGHYLEAAGLLDKQQIIEILQTQQQTSLKFGKIAVDKGWVKQDTIDFFLKCLKPEALLEQIPKCVSQSISAEQSLDNNDPALQILLSPPHIGNLELEFIKTAFNNNWIAPAGPQIKLFEQEFCKAVGASHGVALGSGTASLHLALILAGVQAGDEVFCSTLTFVATANPILYVGAKPVFIDSDYISWNMDPNLLAEALKQRARIGKLPKAVILVHLYGQSADIDPILATCNYYGIPLIEDAAESLGATYKGRSTGTFGHIGIYSFNGNKIITTSGGGMLISEDASLVARASFLATQARDPAPHYQHSNLGYNYRLSNVLAGIGRGQLRVLDQRVAARRFNYDRYQQSLGHLSGINFMPALRCSQGTRWLTSLTINADEFGVTRNEVRERLLAHQIESRPVWKPLHLQPLFSGCECIGGAVAEKLFQEGLCLPSGSNMTETDINRVISVVSPPVLRPISMATL